MNIEFNDVAAVVFDLGRVLIDVQPDRCFAHWSRHANVPVPALRDRFTEDQCYEQFERGEIEFSGFAEHLRKTLKVDLDDATLEAGWNALLGGALPEADDAIAAAAARFPCFLFSNSNAAHQAVWQSEHEDLLAPLHDIFVSSVIGLRKPETDAFRHVADRAGFAPQRILFFDDLAENVAAARAVGYQAVQVRGPHDILVLLS